MNKQAWVVAVDMGYGHQRAAYPLRHLAPNGHVIAANNYQGIPKKDSKLWNEGRHIYEFLSRSSTWPVVGKYTFGILDYFQRIDPFYPKRDLSKPSLQVRQQFGLVKRGLGKDLVNYLNTKNIPLLASFFTVGFMAEEHGFKNDIYLIVTDSDISRAWCTLNPAKSRIKYLVPNRRVYNRLQLYGVQEKNIYLTGFPLPLENMGKSFITLKKDLAERVINLDPEKKYRGKYAETIKQFVRGIKIGAKHKHSLTIAFAVGGAGAQKNIADQILVSLKTTLLKGGVNLNLIAGSRNDVYTYFKNKVENIGLKKILGKSLKIVYAEQKEEYFKMFNESLRTTDILWTKPSELVFYSALGLPIIMAPPLGSQEVFNKTWLKTIGAGISQADPRYTHEWLFDWVNSGWLAEAAMSGFLDGRQFGVKNIEDVVFKGVKEPAKDNSLL